jgi:hypothetical protein
MDSWTDNEILNLHNWALRFRAIEGVPDGPIDRVRIWEDVNALFRNRLGSRK